MKNTSVKGILWLFISKLFPPLINFSVFTYTARILAPEDFGLVALALSFIFIASSFMPTGWRAAIIKHQIADKETISSIFWLHFFISLVLSGIILTFAWVSFFDFQTDIFNAALIIFCIKVIFDGLFFTLDTVLLKKQLYSLIAVRTIFSTVISAIIIIGLLTLDFGIWALIWSQSILSIANFVAVYLPTRKLITFQFSIEKLKALNGFAVYTTLTEGVTTLLSHYESVIIGGILGHRQLGFYNVAKRLSNITSDIFIGTLNDISFPLLASKQENVNDFRTAFLNSVYLSVIILFPIFTFLFVNSEQIFLLLFNEKWLSSVVVFQAFCIMFIFVILGIPQKNVIVLSNHAKWWFQLQLKLSVFAIPITTISAFAGLKYLLIALILTKVVYCTASMLKTCKLLSLKLKDYIFSFLTPLLCSFSIGVIIYLLTPYLPHVNNIFIDIIISAIVYFMGYIVLLYLLENKKLIEMAQTLFPNHVKLKKGK